MIVRSACAVETHDSFDAVPADVWDRALASGPTDVVFLTWGWQRAWWDTYGRGRLLIVVARDADGTTAIAPFFIDGGMAFLVGSGGSDQLDLIGPHDAHTVEAVVRTFDPCLSCSTHAFGKMPLAISLLNAGGEVVDQAIR